MKTIVKYNSKLTDENNNLIIQLVIDDWSSKRSIADLDKNKIYEIEFKEKKSKRSIQQNKLLWAIIGDLSKEMQDDEENIYCHLLEETNAKIVWLIGFKETKEALLRVYRAVKITRYEADGKAVFKCYEGSSKFNTSEMKQLIDKAMDWASEYGLSYDEFNYN